MMNREWIAVCESGKELRVSCRQWKGGTIVSVDDWKVAHEMKQDDDVEAVYAVLELHSGERLKFLRTRA